MSENTRIAVDRDSYIPYFAQVMAILRQRFDNGTWPPGTQLPGEHELCQLFDVSRTVVRQALNELEQEGLIIRQKGRGTFVAEPKIAESLVQKLTGFYQDMVDRGHVPVTQVLKQAVVPASSKVANRLRLSVGEQVIEMERVRFVRDEPIVLVTTYLPFDRCPQAADADFTAQSLYAFLEAQCGLVVVRGQRTLEAVAATEREASLLQVKVGAPLVLLNSVSFLEDGTPLEYYKALHRGDRSKFDVQLIRVREQGSSRELLGGEPTVLPPSNSPIL